MSVHVCTVDLRYMYTYTTVPVGSPLTGIQHIHTRQHRMCTATHKETKNHLCTSVAMLALAASGMLLGSYATIEILRL